MTGFSNETKGLIDFYLTPKPLLKRLLDGLKLRGKTILDACAGTGVIADNVKGRIRGQAENAYRKAVKQRRYYSHDGDDRPAIDVVEIHPDLQKVLLGKGYRLVHGDFLTYQTHKPYDVIVANFPFGEGDRCLAHALELLAPYGGKLHCIVNAETLRNPCTRLRQGIVKRLAELGASVEYLQGEFENALHKTAVEVALVKVQVPEPEPISVVIERLKRAEAVKVMDAAPQELLPNDFLSAIVAQFNKECEIGLRAINEFRALQPYVLDRLPTSEHNKQYASSVLELKIDGDKAGDKHQVNVTRLLRALRKKYWEGLIHDRRFSSQYTSNIQHELGRKLEELKDYDFSAFNIEMLQKELASKIVKGMESAILELFDELSNKHAWYHGDENNIHYYNGWATNKAHKINKKVIVPMYGLERRYNGNSEITYRMKDKLHDITKVFNYLARHKSEHVPSLVAGSVRAANNYQDFKLDMNWFDIKFFKKGTAHLWFKDMELLDKFNIFGSQKKGWLPPCYGKKPYEDMTPDEKAVIDEFQGPDEYAKVMADPSYYIVDTSQLLLMAGADSNSFHAELPA